MRIIVLFFFSILGQSISAQFFTEMLDTPFEGVRLSAVAFADVDGDNDQDVLMTGSFGSGSQTSLYLNDGSGNYTIEIETPFVGVVFGSIAFADVDMDNDQDVLITGQDNSSLPIAKLYINDGAGNFTEAMNTPFEGVYTGSIAFVDVDGDVDLDVLITGQNNAVYGTTGLYTNDGSGNFTLKLDTPFLGVFSSSIAFADVDGDSDQDVLITGDHSPSTDPRDISQLYLNDGVGNFSIMNGTPFEPMSTGDIAFADIDGDNDQDVVITGSNNSLISFANLYTNDGLGNFSLMNGTPFEPSNLGSIAFADVDNDNDQDLMITGKAAGGTLGVRIAKLYINNGSGIFSEVVNTSFEEVSFSAIAFSDVDGDNDQDLMITGWSDSSKYVAKLYINEMSSSSPEVDANRIEYMLHPNPVVGESLKLSFTAIEQKSLTISLLDLNGRTLKQLYEQVPAGQNNHSIDISFIPKGIYLIKLEDDNKIGIQKFVIQ